MVDTLQYGNEWFYIVWCEGCCRGEAAYSAIEEPRWKIRRIRENIQPLGWVCDSDLGDRYASDYCKECDSMHKSGLQTKTPLRSRIYDFTE